MERESQREQGARERNGLGRQSQPTGESLESGASTVARLREQDVPAPADGRAILKVDLGRVEEFLTSFERDPSSAEAVLAGLPDGSWNFSVYADIGWPPGCPEEGIAAALAAIQGRPADEVKPLAYNSQNERVNWNLGNEDRTVLASHLLLDGVMDPKFFYLNVHTRSAGEKLSDQVESAFEQRLADGLLEYPCDLGSGFTHLLDDSRGVHIERAALDLFGALDGLDAEALEMLEEYEYFSELVDDLVNLVNETEPVKAAGGAFNFDDGAFVWSREGGE